MGRSITSNLTDSYFKFDSFFSCCDSQKSAELFTLSCWKCILKNIYIKFRYEMQRRSSQLTAKLMQLYKKGLTKFRLAKIRTLTSAIPVQCSNQCYWASKPTGSWSLNWVATYIRMVETAEWRNKQRRSFFTFISPFRSSNTWNLFIKMWENQVLNHTVNIQ